MWNLLTFCGFRQVWFSIHDLALCASGEFNKLTSYTLQWNALFEYEWDLAESYGCFKDVSKISASISLNTMNDNLQFLAYL
jgi:hypothetical protein